jgi:hypothetical protein
MKALLHIQAARRHAYNIDRMIDPARNIITPARTGGRIGRNRPRRLWVAPAICVGILAAYILIAVAGFIVGCAWAGGAP